MAAGHCGQGPRTEKKEAAPQPLSWCAAPLLWFRPGSSRFGGPAVEVAIQHQDQVIAAAGYPCRVSCTPQVAIGHFR